MTDIPLLDFFADEPIITPASMHQGAKFDLPATVTTALCTFLSEDLDAALLQSILPDCRLLFYVYGRSGKTPIYCYREQCLVVLLTVGSPVAAAVVEELHHLGIQNIIAFGTAGLLASDIADSDLVLIEKAIRDEGTSYHYLPAALYVDTDVALTNVLAELLAPYGRLHRGISWTTDALFRETSARTTKRRQQGAIVVEMECAGFAAAAQRLHVRFAEFVFGSDRLAATWTGFGNQTQQDTRRSRKVVLLQALLAEITKINLPKL